MLEVVFVNGEKNVKEKKIAKVVINSLEKPYMDSDSLEKFYLWYSCIVCSLFPVGVLFLSVAFYLYNIPEQIYEVLFINITPEMLMSIGTLFLILFLLFLRNLCKEVFHYDNKKVTFGRKVFKRANPIYRDVFIWVPLYVILFVWSIVTEVVGYEKEIKSWFLLACIPSMIVISFWVFSDDKKEDRK